MPTAGGAAVIFAAVTVVAAATAAGDAAGTPRLQPLPRLSISRNHTTVSGFSYGGDMAVQAHVAFSKTIKGVCGFAAQPVYCQAKQFTRERTVSKLGPEGRGAPFCDGCLDPLETNAFDHCRKTPSVVDVGQLPDWPRRNCGQPFRADCLDDVVHMYPSRVFLQSGRNDMHTPTDAVANTFAWYATMLTDPKSQVLYNGDLPLGHELPTRNSSTPFDGPGACLRHLYETGSGGGSGFLKPPARAVLPGNLYSFDQRSVNATGNGWAAEGLVYAPVSCKADRRVGPNTGHQCKLHIMMHDCGTRDAPALPPIGAMTHPEEEFARYAETNEIVLLMPRLRKGGGCEAALNQSCRSAQGDAFSCAECCGAHVLELELEGCTNEGIAAWCAGAPQDMVDVSRGCWDVFGQLGKDYAHQSSPHLHPLLPMIQKLIQPDLHANMEDQSEAAQLDQKVTSMANSEQPEGIPREEAGMNVATGEPCVDASGPHLDCNPVKELPRLRIDPTKIAAQGSSSGGDMAVQFQIGFSKHVRGLCGGDAQPWRCAATRFADDVMLPQTHQSSTPTCFGCAANETILYDHCKSHSGFVNPSELAQAATGVPVCGANRSRGGGGSDDCIDGVEHLHAAKIFLTRGECRTYTGSAVENTRQVYEILGAQGIKYFDQCRPDGSHFANDTTAMCLEHVFGPSSKKGTANSANQFRFPQAPFLTDYNVGFAKYGYVYLPTACQAKSAQCGLQVRFHGCGHASQAEQTTQAYAEANNIVLLDPNVPGADLEGLDFNGNNATFSCNKGTAVEGNCKEISRGCWDGYGQLSHDYYMQSAPHMQSVWRMIDHLSSGALKSDDAEMTTGSRTVSTRSASCDTTLQSVCGTTCRKADPPCTFACAECAGTHPTELLAAGCDNDDIVSYCAGLEPPKQKPATDENVHTVHLVFSHHLDVGLNLGINVVEFCTGFATTVIQVYFDEYIPLAMRLAAEINSELETGAGTAGTGTNGRFAYTIHPWIASLYVDCVAWKVQDGCEFENTGQLRCPTPAQVAAFDAAVRRGDLLWADSPMNLNSGVVGEPSMFEGMMDIAGALNERYNLTKTTRVWSNVDVPGFARSSIPLLKQGGATALNILANVGSHYPCAGACSGAIPTEFLGESWRNQSSAMWRWHDPASGDEILVLYHKAQYDTPADIPLIDVGTSYGGFTRLDNMIVAPAGGIALASAVLADNTGPPSSAAEVRKIFELVRGVFPNATAIVGSTWDRFVADISPAEIATLPRYSSEWGDQWVRGMVNDPGRLATYRALVRARADCMASGGCSLRDPVMRNFTRFITKNSEHTQGVQGNGMQPGSQECIWKSDGIPGTSCPANAWWKNDAFQAHHSLTANGFPGADDSWIEDRLFSQLAISAVPTAHPLMPFVRRELEALVPRPLAELAPVVPIDLSSASADGRTISCRGTILEFSSTGALDRLTFRGSDQPWSRLMDLRYLKFRPYDRQGVVCNESSCPNPIAGAYEPVLLGFRTGAAELRGDQSCSVVLELGFNESLHREYGAPTSVTAEYSIDPVRNRLNVSLTWRNKTATRMQESLMVFHRPFARAGHRWEMDKLGEWVSPANVTGGGNQYQHALWTGVRYTTSDAAAAPRGLLLGTLDAGMACPVLNKVADSALTPEDSLIKSCFKQDIKSKGGSQQRVGQQQRVTDAMIDGLGINLHANLFTISGYPQWYLTYVA
jgi:hypothetical protein